MNPSVPQVFKHYRLERRIGAGSMGTVWEGTDRRDGSRVAIKILHPGLAAADPGFRERFQSEAHLAALLRSPYTVKLLDFGEQDGLLFMVMEFVAGRSLQQLIKDGPLEPLRAAHIAQDVARALEEAEARGVIHRDIKPANVLIGSGDSVKVADFGIARQAGSPAVSAPGAFVGTIAYAAPEQFNGLADHRTDVFAVGATLYAMLTGEPPNVRAGGSIAALETFPQPLQTVVRRCLEHDPEDRYRTATELAAALTRAMTNMRQSSQGGLATGVPTGASHPVTSPPSPPPQSSAPPPSYQPPPPSWDPPTAPYQPQPEPVTMVDPQQSRAAPPSRPGGTPIAPRPRLRLVPRGWADSRHAAHIYELTVENPAPTPAQVRLSARDDTGQLMFTMAASVAVAPGGSARTSIQVRAAKRRWLGGPRKLVFRVEASDSSGLPPVAISSDFADEPDRRTQAIALASGGGALAVVAVAVLAASGVFGGGNAASPDDPTRTPTSTSTRTTTTTATSTATTTTATATATTPATPTVPPSSVNSGDWTYTFVIESDNCGTSDGPGASFRIVYRLSDANRDGYVTAGELVEIRSGDQFQFFLGSFSFTFPQFTFQYPVSDGGTATVGNTYLDLGTVRASYTESYQLGNGDSCSIYGVAE